MSNGPSRRLFQFRLRTLFVIVTACALASPAFSVAIAAYKKWQRDREWSEAGGPGYIKPFPPITCSFDECFFDDSAIENEVSKLQVDNKP